MNSAQLIVSIKGIPFTLFLDCHVTRGLLPDRRASIIVATSISLSLRVSVVLMASASFLADVLKVIVVCGNFMVTSIVML
jgi:hypothetical protein